MGLLHSPPVHFRHPLQLRFEVLTYLLLRDAADGGILGQETDIGKIVKHGEQGYLRELGDARDKHQPFVFIIGLQYGEHLTVHFRAAGVLGRMPRVLKRSVVFIYKNDDLQPCLLVGGLYNSVEAVGKLRRRLWGYGIPFLISAKANVKI